MAVVSRTMVTVVLKTRDAEGNVNVKPLGEMTEDGAEALKQAYGGNAEIGYMPMTYEMEEKSFMKSAKLTTDVANVPLFPTRESCPKSAAELKKYMKNN